MQLMQVVDTPARRKRADPVTEQQLLHTCLACNYAGAIKRYASSCIILTARALDVPQTWVRITS